MANAVFGMAASEFQGEAILNELKVARFSDDDISVLLGDKTSQSAASDKVAGGTLGWLAGIESVAIPGIGPFIATGPVLESLRAAAVGHSASAIASALCGMGLSSTEARRYEQNLRRGCILVAVHCETEDETSRAEAIFAQGGAQDVTVSTDASAEMQRGKWGT